MSTQPSFRRVHRLTPLLRLWSVILALIAAFALNVNLEALRDIFAFITGEHRGEALRDTALAFAAFAAGNYGRRVCGSGEKHRRDSGSLRAGAEEGQDKTEEAGEYRR